jgi:hypothetical protein
MTEAAPTPTPTTDSAIDSRNVLAKLASSRAVIFACFLLAVVGVLVALGRVPYSELVSMAKWLGGIFVAGKSVEGAVASLSQR